MYNQYMPYIVGQRVYNRKNNENGVITVIDDPIVDNRPIRVEDLVSSRWWYMRDVEPYEPTDEEVQRYMLWKMKN